MHRKPDSLILESNHNLELDIIFNELPRTLHCQPIYKILKFLIKEKNLPVLRQILEKLHLNDFIIFDEVDVILESQNIKNVVGYYLGQFLDLYSAQFDSKEYYHIYSIINNYQISLSAFILGAVRYNNSAKLDHFAKKFFTSDNYDELYTNNNLLTNINNLALQKIYSFCEKSATLNIAIVLSISNIGIIVRLLRNRSFDKEMVNIIIHKLLDKDEYNLAIDIIREYNPCIDYYDKNLLKKALLNAYKANDTDAIEHLIGKYVMSQNRHLKYYSTKIQNNILYEQKQKILLEFMQNDVKQAIKFVVVTELEKYGKNALVPYEMKVIMKNYNFFNLPPCFDLSSIVEQLIEYNHRKNVWATADEQKSYIREHEIQMHKLIQNLLITPPAANFMYIELAFMHNNTPTPLSLDLSRIIYYVYLFNDANIKITIPNEIIVHIVSFLPLYNPIQINGQVDEYLTVNENTVITVAQKWVDRLKTKTQEEIVTLLERSYDS